MKAETPRTSAVEATAAAGAGALAHHRFEARARATPQAVALVHGEETLTYGELEDRAGRIARHLAHKGIGPETCVAVCMERSFDLVAAVLGVLKAGAAVLPLDPLHPDRWLKWAIGDSRTPLVLTQDSLRQRLARGRAEVVCVDAQWREIAGPHPRAALREALEGNLSFVFYTSGSTGESKAVMWTHTRLQERNRNHEYFGLTPADRHLLKAGLSFTLFQRELFWPLLTGARAVIVPHGRENDIALLERLLVDNGISVLNLVPSLLRVLIDADVLDACATLRHITCYGEPLDAELQRRVCTRTKASLTVFYGATEAPSATMWGTEDSRDGQGVNEGIDIGTRLSNRRVYLLDEGLNAVPPGAVGELYVGGGPARGYLNRPDLTAERFIPDPYSDTPGARMYRTGDLARELAGGRIEFLGRTDDQVQINGVRVEPRHVEVVLRRHPGVGDAAVMARDAGVGSRRLVAFVATGAAQPPAQDALREFLGLHLPAPMIPSSFVMVPELPRALSGKVDRQALSMMPVAAPAGPVPDDAAPGDEVESRLAGLWREVLGTDRVGIHDSFFDLGGDSLASARLLAEIRRDLGRDVSLAEFFRAPTIRGVARLLQDGPAARDSGLVALQSGGSKPPLFLVPGAGGDERALVFLYGELVPHLGGDQPLYGLVARGTEGFHAPHDRVEDMAADYIREIRQVQPGGPYHLVGGCIGGAVAYEMAQQLTGGGEQVAALVLLDVPFPVRTAQEMARWRRPTRRPIASRSIGLLRSLRARAAHHRRVLAELAWPQRLRYVLMKLAKSRAYYHHNAHPYMRFHSDPKIARRIERARRNYRQVLSSYRPRPYDGKILAIINDAWNVQGYADSWGELAKGGIRIYVVPGDHRSNIRQHSAQVARRLREALACE